MVLLCVVEIIIDAKAHGEIRIACRSRNKDLLSAGIDVLLSAWAVGKETSGLEDNVNIPLTPREICRVTLSGSVNLVPVNDEVVIVIVHFTIVATL